MDREEDVWFWKVFNNIYIYKKIITYVRLLNFHNVDTIFKDVNQLSNYGFKNYLKRVFYIGDYRDYDLGDPRRLKVSTTTIEEILDELPTQIEYFKFLNFRIVPPSSPLSFLKFTNLISISFKKTNFNQIITENMLPVTLKYLNLGEHYSQIIPVNSLPPSLESFITLYVSDYQIGSLPSSLTFLKLKVIKNFAVDSDVNGKPSRVVTDIQEFKNLKIYIKILSATEKNLSIIPNNTSILNIKFLQSIVNVVKLPDSIKDLTIYARCGVKFKIDKLPISLINLTDNTHYNHCIDYSFSNCMDLVNCKFKYLNDRNHLPQINTFTNSVKSMEFIFFDSHLVDIIPQHLQSFKVTWGDILVLYNKPFARNYFTSNSLTSLDIGNSFMSFKYQQIPNLIDLSCNINIDLSHCPKSLKHLTFYCNLSTDIIKPIYIPSSIESVKLDYGCAFKIYPGFFREEEGEENSKFNKLIFGKYNQYPLSIDGYPSSIRNLEFSIMDNMKLDSCIPIPSNVTELTFNDCTTYNSFILNNESLPKHLKVLNLNNCNLIGKTLSTLPNSLTKLIVYNSNINFLNSIDLFEFTDILKIIKNKINFYNL